MVNGIKKTLQKPHSLIKFFNSILKKAFRLKKTKNIWANQP